MIRPAGERLLSGQARHRLPNQLTIAHLNPYETDYVYTEIFGDRCYMKHGITLRPGDTVIDIGANIGLVQPLCPAGSARCSHLCV